VLEVATGGLAADLTILLDCEVSVAAARTALKVKDRFESEHAAFLERVRAGYLDLARTSPGWVVVDGSAPLDAVGEAVDGALGALAR
jgi:dTMP kinase